MGKPIILIDMDGVIADYRSAMIQRVNQTYNLSIDNLEVWDRTHKQQHLDLQREPHFFLGFEPIEKALEAIRAMDAQYNILFVSSPCCGNDTCHSDKHNWLKKHLGMSFARKLILTKDKTVVRGDILIDDRIQTGRMKPTWAHILFRTPANRRLNEDDFAGVLDGWDNWQQVVEEVLSYADSDC